MVYEIEILEKLVAIDTDSLKKTGYVEAASLLVDECELLGLSVRVYDGVEVTEDRLPRPNVVAFLDAGARKTLLIISHYDIVPPGTGWSTDPFRPVRRDDMVFGRGAADNKGGIVASLGAAKALKGELKRNLLLAFVCDEEVGGRAGLGYLMKEVDLRADEALIVDSGNETLAFGASGVMEGEIRVRGIQGHAGYPFRAVNPIYPTAKLVAKLEEFSSIREGRVSKFPAPPGSPKPHVWGRFSVTVLRAGEKSNVIPGEATLLFDLRLIPEEDPSEASREFGEFLERAKRELGVSAELVRLTGGGNYYTNVNDPFVVKFREAIQVVAGRPVPLACQLGANDGRYTKAKGIPTVCFGPIAADSRYHGVDEFVRLSDIILTRDAIVEYVARRAP